jgi:hypothetical protein
MAYICTEKGKGDLFDPNRGVIAIQDEKSFGSLANIICDYQAVKKTLSKNDQQQWDGKLVFIRKIELKE